MFQNLFQITGVIQRQRMNVSEGYGHNSDQQSSRSFLPLRAGLGGAVLLTRAGGYEEGLLLSKSAVPAQWDQRFKGLT